MVDAFPKLSETFVLDQVEGLRRRGHRVEVLCNRVTVPGCGRPHWGPLSGLRPLLSRLPLRAGHRFRRALDRLDGSFLSEFDVVLAHFGYEGARIADLAAHRPGLPPLVTIYHGHDVATVHHDGGLSLYGTLFREGAAHLPVNDRFRGMLVEAGAPRARTRVNHMGIDLSRFRFAARDWTARPLRLLSVCRLTEKKGIGDAIAALDILQKELPDLDWSYDIVGGGELAARLRMQVRESSVSRRITFHGPLPHREVHRLLTRCHLFLLPSVVAGNGDAEGIPVSLMEAMATGAVAVSTYHSGIPELMENGVSGLLAPERDPRALASLLRGVAADPKGLALMARRGRATIETGFDAQRQLDLLEAELRLASRRPDRAAPCLARA
ncbi:colanic acid/amylovoran biosynthesis glycosyltransferase [Wenxinia saemankumensis]|uniref:Colanic acid/amylovoran biosynthesis glycosyltransferase n=1 Tax=Wenxinia saemankumensis TaxID=1447782 RepID=A0A1M5ZYL6_9RHOB|nr:colanic acid/amylovoran biosynthesis glycosyltransferase [Wenxinia saemankumensis]